jgi:hypothetical protein
MNSIFSNVRPHIKSKRDREREGECLIQTPIISIYHKIFIKIYYMWLFEICVFFQELAVFFWNGFPKLVSHAAVIETEKI